MTDSTRSLDDALSTPGPVRTTGMHHLGEMPGGSRIDVPFTVLRGGGPGPTVWIMAARDGDEVHATLIAMELQRRLVPEELAGSVIVMPIGNVPGFGVLSREHPLAPTYLEQQMDDRFFDVLSERGGSFIDLHSAGVPSNTVDWTLFVEGDDKGLAMARAYGSPYLYEHRMGGGEGPDPGLLDGALQILRSFRIVTASRGGLFEDGVELGDHVQDGQVLARVIDAHGDLVEEVRAPVAGVILTVPVNPAVGTGTWAYEIGW